MRTFVLVAFTGLLVAATGCGFGTRGKREDAAAVLAAVRSAHDAYVQSINANKVDEWMSALTDDVVYFVPNQPAIVGKEAVGAWATRYLQEVTTRWTKSVQDLQVSGDWAFGRYTYTASDSVVIRDPETDGGGTANDSGWGFVVYHRDGDGRWRVARDGWGSERPSR
jgi:ketosteroid isomerase-like protein